LSFSFIQINYFAVSLHAYLAMMVQTYNDISEKVFFFGKTFVCLKN